LAVEGYIYYTTGHNTNRQTQFSNGVGCSLHFQFPKFASCILYPFGTLIFCNSIALLLYLFDTLPFIQSTPQKKRGRPHTNQTKFCTGGRLFIGNYPPYIIPPKIPRHNFAIYRYIFRHITGQNKTPFLSIFIVLYLEFIVFSFFRRHISPVRLLMFAG
jgi:hypothetical protein